jgi:hypothetical protein
MVGWVVYQFAACRTHARLQCLVGCAMLSSTCCAVLLHLALRCDSLLQVVAARADFKLIIITDTHPPVTYA